MPPQHFKSRKDLLFKLVFFGTWAGCAAAFAVFHWGADFTWLGFFFFDLVLLLCCALMVWIYFDTRYTLTSEHLHYKSGPFKGSVSLDSIREVIAGETLWSGMKPALARDGIVIKFNKYDEVYISPESNEEFLKSLSVLTKNMSITIRVCQ